MTTTTPYTNEQCDRCDAPKAAPSKTLWCDACDALPCCEDCGEPVDDCECFEHNAADPASDYYLDDGITSDYSERMSERKQMGLCNY